MEVETVERQEDPRHRDVSLLHVLRLANIYYWKHATMQRQTRQNGEQLFAHVRNVMSMLPQVVTVLRSWTSAGSRYSTSRWCRSQTFGLQWHAAPSLSSPYLDLNRMAMPQSSAYHMYAYC